MKLSRPIRTLLLHATAWTAFILYEVSFILIFTDARSSVLRYAEYYVLNILLFYFNAHVTLNYALIKKKSYSLLILLIIAELALYILLVILVDKGLRPYPGYIPSPATRLAIEKSLWRALYFLFFSTAYWFALFTIAHKKRIGDLEILQLKEEQEKAELENRLMQSQNAWLRAQINPHLLFNTLNFIYNSLEEEKDGVVTKVNDSVLLLSEIMRYALMNPGNDGKVELSKEIEYIEKYITLNQLRFNYPLCLEIGIGEVFDQDRVPPLLLLPLVENLFKYGDLTSPGSPALVKIACQDHHLYLYISNKKRKGRMPNGTGVGLQNVETRLKSYYTQGNFNFLIYNSENEFSVTLNLLLA